MKTLPSSQATFLDETEFPLMSSPAGSHAKISQPQASKPGCQKEPEAAYGPKSLDLLATYDHPTSSWRTLQICLVARLNGEADGLAEYSETWPSAGMMQSGKTYRRQPWALPIAESASGLLPTPLKSEMQASFTVSSIRKALDGGRQEHLCFRPIMLGWGRDAIATMYAEVMGFPDSWASLTHTETQFSRQ